MPSTVQQGETAFKPELSSLTIQFKVKQHSSFLFSFIMTVVLKGFTMNLMTVFIATLQVWR